MVTERRRPLDRRTILEAAVRFVDSEGLDALSMRKLGAELGVEAMSLYNHVPNKGALLDGMVEVSPWIGVFIAVGAFLVVAYNLELFGGAFHSDLWFALAWGAFPVVTAYFAQARAVNVAAVVAAAACAMLSAAQRALSTPVRRLRRRVDAVRGGLVLHDGSREPISAATPRGAPERALRLLSAAVPLLAAAMLAAKLV